MKPVRPLIFSAQDLGKGHLESFHGGRAFLRLLRSVGETFSTVLLAHAARPGSRTVIQEVSRLISAMGMNVFLARVPAPVIALSQELGRRSMPLGLYLNETSDNDWSLTPVALHGGPVDDDMPAGTGNEPLSRNGVVGEVEILGSYVKRLAGLLDPRPEPGIRFSRLESPFPQISEMLAGPDGPRILQEFDPQGPIARVDPSGQSLTVELPSGKFLSSEKLVQMVGTYLTRERASTGTIVGPPGTAALAAGWGEIVEVDGDALDMSHAAGYVNLLLGWWEPGIIAHQGHGPFGDGFLTAGYLLEAWAASPPTF